MTLPQGFRLGATAAQMRYKDRFDLGLIVADSIQAAAGVFTTSITRAAPVLWSSHRLSRARAILTNAGQANAQSGEQGLADCKLCAKALADLLGYTEDQILLASTGVIGQPLNMNALLAALPNLTKSVSTEGQLDFAKSIMTTDTFPKTHETQINFSGGSMASIWGAAKGSGMIAPNMATMLGFVLTDASVEPKLLQSLLAAGADATFNRVTVDGDTSTNDTLFILASGAANRPLITGGPDAEIFNQALMEVLESLARQLARDGEGATHLVELQIKGARNQEEALKAARTVAESPLVKTAFYGCDANWGRILAALGRSGAFFDPYQVDIDLDDVPWIRKGLDNGQETEASTVMKRREYKISIDLKAGNASEKMLTCDFSHDYITINGSYRS